MGDLLAVINWGPSPEIIGIGPLSLRWYGILFALGFVVGYLIMQKIFIKENKSAKDLEALTITMIIGTVVGARLGHCLFYEPSFYLMNPIKILYIWEGGLASHGAAIGNLLALWFYAKSRSNISFMWIVDRIVIVAALAGCFIRLGNFFNSEIIGAPADVPWAVVFTRIDDIARHPAQIYEALAYLISFFILLFTYNRNQKNLPNGYLFGLFLVLIFGTRIIMEFFKEPQVAFEADMILNLGQLLSIPFVIIGTYLIFRAKRLIK